MDTRSETTHINPETPPPTPSKYNQERIVGINNVHFMIHQDMRPNRKNVFYKSAQFQTIIESMEKEYPSKDTSSYILRIQQLFEQNKNKLTDIEVETIGYY